MSLFSWDDMRFFLALARDGQLTGAARHLGTSHVTVARRIDRLEAALNQRLFERSARGYGLTPAGRRLIQTAERMEAASADVALGEGRGAGLTGTLRLAVPEGFASFFTDHLLTGFTERFPTLSLELITLTQVLSLSRREADLTVTLDPVTRGAWGSERLADYALRIHASRDYLGSHPPIRQPEDLRAHPFIGYIEEMLFAPALDYLDEVQPGLRIGFKSSSIFNQLTATRRGLGLCVLPCYMAAACPDLLPVLPEAVTLRRSYWLSCHADLRQMRRERTVIAWLAGALRGAQPLLLP